MNIRSTHREVPEQHRAAEHLANERTFLAWVRTNIALFSLGFVMARLSLWLHTDHSIENPVLAGRGLTIGVGMVVVSAILTVLAAWRYHSVNHQIETGMVKTDRALVWFITTVMILLSAAMTAYMLTMR
jgi:putative membrane protein